MIRQIAGVVRRRIRSFLNRGIILMYHRVATLPFDPQLLSVSPVNFAEQMDVLRRTFRPLSLVEMTTDLNKGTPKTGFVAVTFDDGYADNCLEALPLLELYDIPATFFVITRCIESRKELWWDELERLLLREGNLPSKIRLHAFGKNFEWHLESSEQYGASEVGKNGAWNVRAGEDPTERHRMYRSLHAFLRPLPAAERSEVLSQLAAVVGTDSDCRPSHRTLTEKELLSLSGGALIEIGAHTRTHPVLSTLDRKTQMDEIAGSKMELEEIINRPVTSFAYPYGGSSDYNQTTIDAVKASGFQRACSNFSGALRRKTDLFQLPRFIVPNCGGEEFRQKLHAWFSH